MTTAAKVKLWSTTIGYVSLADNENYARFQYDEAFLESDIETSPLLMPLSRQVYSFPQLSLNSFHGLPVLLADSLPDRFGNAVINSWLSSQGRSTNSLDAVERLCYTGKRGMGALEYEPSIGPNPTSYELLQVDQLVELASRILRQRESFHLTKNDHAMEQIIRVGTSAGGARAKALVAFNEQTGELRSGQVDAGEGFGYWLMKFDGVTGNRDKENEDPPHYTVVEYAYSLMAKAAGIAMTDCRLFPEGDRVHFLTRRFDRNEVSSDKIHMQTLGALAGFDFNEAGSHSYEEAAEIARHLGLYQPEAEEIYRRMMFNVMALNHDDHVKNMSFLMDRNGKWSLAPAYDVTYAYNPQGLWTSSHQMTINGKRSDITIDDCMEAAKHMGIKASRALSIKEKVRDALSRWETFADEAGLPEQKAEAIGRQFIWL